MLPIHKSGDPLNEVPVRFVNLRTVFVSLFLVLSFVLVTLFYHIPRVHRFVKIFMIAIWALEMTIFQVFSSRKGAVQSGSVLINADLFYVLFFCTCTILTFKLAVCSFAVLNRCVSLHALLLCFLLAITCVVALLKCYHAHSRREGVNRLFLCVFLLFSLVLVVLPDIDHKKYENVKQAGNSTSITEKTYFVSQDKQPFVFDNLASNDEYPEKIAVSFPVSGNSSDSSIGSGITVIENKPSLNRAISMCLDGISRCSKLSNLYSGLLSEINDLLLQDKNLRKILTNPILSNRKLNDTEKKFELNDAPFILKNSKEAYPNLSYILTEKGMQFVDFHTAFNKVIKGSDIKNNYQNKLNHFKSFFSTFSEKLAANLSNKDNDSETKDALSEQVLNKHKEFVTFIEKSTVEANARKLKMFVMENKALDGISNFMFPGVSNNDSFYINIRNMFDFISLVEINKQKVMSCLTHEKFIDEIEKCDYSSLLVNTSFNLNFIFNFIKTHMETDIPLNNLHDKAEEDVNNTVLFDRKDLEQSFIKFTKIEESRNHEIQVFLKQRKFESAKVCFSVLNKQIMAYLTQIKESLLTNNSYFDLILADKSKPEKDIDQNDVFTFIKPVPKYLKMNNNDLFDEDLRICFYKIRSLIKCRDMTFLKIKALENDFEHQKSSQKAIMEVFEDEICKLKAVSDYQNKVSMFVFLSNSFEKSMNDHVSDFPAFVNISDIEAVQKSIKMMAKQIETFDGFFSINCEDCKRAVENLKKMNDALVLSHNEIISRYN